VPPPLRPPGLEFLVALNSADVSADHLLKLRRQLEGCASYVSGERHTLRLAFRL
jgi:hypothetical protein